MISSLETMYIFAIPVIIILFAALLCCRAEPIVESDAFHEDFFVQYSSEVRDGAMPNREQKREILARAMIIKKVIESVDTSSRSCSTSSETKNDIEMAEEHQQKIDDKNQSERSTGSKHAGRVYHSFASALVKSNRSIKFAPPMHNQLDVVQNKEPNSIKKPNPKLLVRHKSNIIARRISLSLQTLGTESEPVGCNICLMEFEVGEDVSWSRNQDCIHGFHKECILDWLMVKNECPVCRREYILKRGEGH